VSGADPLNLVGILTPGEAVAAITSNRVLYRDGVPIVVKEGEGKERVLVDVPAEERDLLRGALRRRRPAPLVPTCLAKGQAAAAALLVVVVEDRRAILATHVAALAVERSRVVQREEHTEQVAIGELVRVERHLHHLGVPRRAGANRLVARIGYVPAGIPRDDFRDAAQLLEDRLETPEAAATQSGQLCAHLFILAGLSSGWSPPDCARRERNPRRAPPARDNDRVPAQRSRRRAPCRVWLARRRPAPARHTPEPRGSRRSPDRAPVREGPTRCRVVRLAAASGRGRW